MLKLRYSLIGLALILNVPAAANSSRMIHDEAGVRVSYADLNLSSSEGRHSLQRRIDRAANRLCVNSGLKPLARATAEQRCVSTILAGARADIEQAVEKQSVRLASKSAAAPAAR